VYVNSDPVNYTDLWGLSASDKNFFQKAVDAVKNFFSPSTKVTPPADQSWAQSLRKPSPVEPLPNGTVWTERGGDRKSVV
jgi:hypothetical protein